MLHRLLSLLQEGGTRRITDLARQLDTTPELVEAMLEDLARMGYVKRVASQCSETCSACPMSQTCAAGASGQAEDGGQIWVLTESRTAA
jgi:DNA-binding Lrp family transcriptional regulator